MNIGVKISCMGEKRMLTAKEFAIETGISYPIVIRWLKDQEEQPNAPKKLPGATRTSFKVWQIPAALVTKFSKEENKPKPGWKKGRKRKKGSATK
jgi:hypothetical protein